LAKLVKTLVLHKDLIVGLTMREIQSRYRGATFGIFWALLNPLIMLAVYTFFFTEVLKAKWPGIVQSSLDFSLVLFPGLIMFGFFSECVSKAPTLIVNNQGFVKKIVFPLEILPVVSLFGAFFHAAVGLLIWCAFFIAIKHELHLSTLLVAAPFVPLGLMTLGISMALAALGTYLRDTTHVVAGLLGGLIFLSPIFYPISILPEKYRGIIMLNPITVAVEQIRAVLYHGQMIDWTQWSVYLLVSLVVASLGLWVFQRARVGFADVL